MSIVLADAKGRELQPRCRKGENRGSHGGPAGQISKPRYLLIYMRVAGNGHPLFFMKRRQTVAKQAEHKPNQSVEAYSNVLSSSIQR
jgi:hypothetical protein